MQLSSPIYLSESGIERVHYRGIEVHLGATFTFDLSWPYHVNNIPSRKQLKLALVIGAKPSVSKNWMLHFYVGKVYNYVWFPTYCMNLPLPFGFTSFDPNGSPQYHRTIPQRQMTKINRLEQTFDVLSLARFHQTFI